MFAVTSPSDAARPPQRHELQRTRGSVLLHIERRAGDVVVARRYRDGAMQVRTPRTFGLDAPEAVLINTAGGLTGGDRVQTRVVVAEGAAVTMTTQACEKIYRASVGDAEIDQHLQVAAGGYAESLPQPTIVFNAARLRRSSRIELAPEARMLVVEACILGRAAMRESLTRGLVDDGWHVRRAGLPVFVDRTRIAGDFEGARGRAAMLAGAAAFATCLYAGSDAADRLDAARASLAGATSASMRAAASVWRGLLCVRWLAHDGSALTRALTSFLEDFRGRPLPRSWYC